MLKSSETNVINEFVGNLKFDFAKFAFFKSTDLFIVLKPRPVQMFPFLRSHRFYFHLSALMKNQNLIIQLIF